MATEDQTIQQLSQSLGPNVDQASADLLKYEYEAQQGRQLAGQQFANDQYDAFAGKWIPSNMDEEAWKATIEAAHTFALNTDSRLMPSWQQVVNLYEWSSSQGISLSDPRQVANYFAQQMPADAKSKMPWAASGMNYNQWNGTVQSLGDWFQTQTGQRPAGADLQSIQDAINQGQTTAQIQASFTQNQQFQKTYGWTKFGMTYDQFQKTKNDPNMQQQITARFGSGSVNSDQAYLEQLGTAPSSIRSTGQPQQSQSQRVQANRSNLSDIR